MKDADPSAYLPADGTAHVACSECALELIGKGIARGLPMDNAGDAQSVVDYEKTRISNGEGWIELQDDERVSDNR